MCVAEGTDGRGDGRVIGRRMKLFISSGREECFCRFGGRGLAIVVPGFDAKVKILVNFTRETIFLGEE